MNHWEAFKVASRELSRDDLILYAFGAQQGLSTILNNLQRRLLVIDYRGTGLSSDEVERMNLLSPRVIRIVNRLTANQGDDDAED